MKLFLTVVIFALISFAPAYAEGGADVGLYDPLPPKHSAFVRFISNRPVTGSEEIKANGKTFDYLDYREVSSYFVLPGGHLKIQVGEALGEFDVEEGGFYTVVLNPDKTLGLKKDPGSDNQAKAQIIFYNLSQAADVSLKTADGKIDIVPTLSPGQISDRQINPVKVSLAVYDGGQKLKDLGPVSLERARSYSAFIMGDKDVLWVRSSTNTSR